MVWPMLIACCIGRQAVQEVCVTLTRFVIFGPGLDSEITDIGLLGQFRIYPVHPQLVCR